MIKAWMIEGNGTFAEDVPQFAEAIKGSGAEVVLVPGNSRVKRAMPAAALRAGAEVDTNVVDIEVSGETVTVLTFAVDSAGGLVTIDAGDGASVFAKDRSSPMNPA